MTRTGWDCNLIHASADLDEVRCHRGELVIDVAQADDSGSVVSVGLRLADRDTDELVPLLFIGATGHGLVCLGRAEVEAGEPVDRCG